MQGLIESEDLSSSEFGSDEERNLLEKDNTQGILDSNTVGKRINDSTSSYNLVERRSRREFEPMRARNRQDLEPTRARNRQELETTRARYRQELEPAERDYDSPSPSPSVLIIESEEPSVLIIETAERNTMYRVDRRLFINNPKKIFVVVTTSFNIILSRSDFKTKLSICLLNKKFIK